MLMKKHTALNQNIKNDTSIEFRCDIKSTDTAGWYQFFWQFIP